MLLKTLRKPRLLLFLFGFLFISYLLWQARGALTPFAAALVIAYLILPVVNIIQRYMPEEVKRRGIARPLAILVVYLMGLLLLTLLLRSLVPPIIHQVSQLYNNVDTLYSQATNLVNQAIAQYEQFPPEVQQRIQTQLQGFDPATVLDPAFAATRQALGAVTNTVAFMLGLIVIPFWLFFILNDQGVVTEGAMGIIPRDLQPDVEAVRIIVDRILSAYLRGQLLVATAIGTSITIGLLILDVQFALLLGLAAGMLALIPVIGAFLGAIPAVIVAFLQSPQLALWVILLFVVIQQIDNAFISPRILGGAVALHPALIMVVIVVGSTLFGVAGALVAVPFTAILRDVGHYFYIRVGEEPITPVEALIQTGYINSLTPRILRDAPATLVLPAGD